MLKIKDSVDLKELEKLGFEENEYDTNFVRESRTKKGNYVFVTVDRNTKQIKTTIASVYETQFNGTNYFKDLIKADLVEEVEGV